MTALLTLWSSRKDGYASRLSPRISAYGLLSFLSLVKNEVYVAK